MKNKIGQSKAILLLAIIMLATASFILIQSALAKANGMPPATSCTLPNYCTYITCSPNEEEPSQICPPDKPICCKGEQPTYTLSESSSVIEDTFKITIIKEIPFIGPILTEAGTIKEGEAATDTGTQVESSTITPEQLEQIENIEQVTHVERESAHVTADLPPQEELEPVVINGKKAGEKVVEESKNWNLAKLIPCSGVAGVLRPGDCTLDRIITLLSVIQGVRMSAALTNIKGGCAAETPIKGLTSSQQAALCKSCNDDPLKICTLDRCLILGNCIPIPPQEGTAETLSNYICVPGKCDDQGAVEITKIEAGFYSGGELTSKPEPNPISGNTDKLVIDPQTDLIPFNADSVSVEITTDQLAQCRYSFNAQSDFGDMTDFDNNYFPGSVDNPDKQEATIPLEGDLARGEQYTIYIKCKNSCGVVHEKTDDNRYVRFKFQEKPEQLPPIIVFMDPDNAGVVSGDLKDLVAEFHLDENGNCRYSDNWTTAGSNPAPLTTTWEEMIDFKTGNHQTGSSVKNGLCSQNQQCEHLTTEECAYCNLNLDLTKGYTNLSWDKLPADLQQEMDMNEITKIFHFKIRCEDERNNKMAEEDTLDYTFFTVPPYTMEIVRPEDVSLTYEIHPDIQVTSTRNTECRYEAKKLLEGQDCSSIRDRYSPTWENMVLIDDSITKEHSGIVQEELEPSLKGTPYCLFVKCRDSWLLERQDEASIKVLLDRNPPRIIRMYHDTFAGDYLLTETNEKATCTYGTDDEIGCGFDIKDGTEMTGINETIHTAYWSLDHLYYIKCIDRWNNQPGKGTCTAVINPFELPAI